MKPDNIGKSDRWQDPRDISGGETDWTLPRSIYVWLVPSEEVLEQPGSWRIRMWDTAPFPEANYTLARSETSFTKHPRCADGCINADKGGRGACTERCDMFPVPQERADKKQTDEKGRPMTYWGGLEERATNTRKPWQSAEEAMLPPAVQEAIRKVLEDFGEIPDRNSPEDFPDGYVLTRREIVDGLLEVLRSSTSQWQPIATAPKGDDVILTDGEKVSQGGWIDEREHGMVGWWSVDGGGWTPTHWMPLPGVPGAFSASSKPISGIGLIKSIKKQRDDVANVLRDLRRAINDFDGHGMPGFRDRALAMTRLAEVDAILATIPTYEQQLRNLAEGVGMTCEELMAAMARVPDRRES